MKKLHQTQWWNILSQMLIFKSYTKWKKKYTKFNHEIFYTKFLIKKIYQIKKIHQTHSWNILHRIFIFKKLHHIQKKNYTQTKNFTANNKTFTPNLSFFFFLLHQIRKIWHKTSKFLHQIRNILHQTDGTFGLP